MSNQKKAKVQNNTVVREGPLSFCQELMLLNVKRFKRFRPAIAEFVELSGEIDPIQVSRSLDATIAAYETLRTRYIARGSRLRAEVMTHSPKQNRVTLVDMQGTVDATDEIRSAICAHLEQLDAEGGSPVTSILLRRDTRSWLWLLAVHHLASDGWSQHLYGRFFSTTIRSTSSGFSHNNQGIAGSSLDYAARQKAWFDTEAAQRQLEWWINKVRPLPPQEHPLRTDHSKVDVGITIQLEHRLQGQSHAALCDIARRERIPMLAIAFAALATIVARRTGCSTVSVLSLVGGRTLPGADKAAGAFYNTILLTLDTQRASDGGDLLRAAGNAVFEGWRRQEVPLGLVFEACAERNIDINAGAFPLILNFVQHALTEFRIPGCAMYEIDQDNFTSITHRADGIQVRHKRASSLSDATTLLVCSLAQELRVNLEFSQGKFGEDDARVLLEEYVDELRALANRYGEVTFHSGVTPSGMIYAKQEAP